MLSQLVSVRLEFVETDGVTRLIVSGELCDNESDLDSAELAIANLSPGSNLLIDLRGLTEWSTLGRASLMEFHRRQCKGQCLRTCYLVDRPRLHGMALLVVRLADDEQATTATTSEAARQWFSSTLGRQAHKIEVINRTRDELNGGDND